MIIKMFRIFDDKNNFPHTLFHGVNGKRKLPLDTWIDANVKEVMDGNHGKTYESGFHVLDTFEEVMDFLKMFRNLKGRVICPVEVDLSHGIWNKEHSKSNIFLVKRIRITSKDWENRIKLDEYSNL